VRCIGVVGNSVVSVSNDYTMKIWNLTTNQCTHTLSTHKKEIYGVACDEWKIVSACDDGILGVWKWDGTFLYGINIPGRPSCVKFDRTRLYIGDRNGNLYVFNFDVKEQKVADNVCKDCGIK